MSNLQKVLQRPKIAENYSRNAFDRSEVHNLHYQLGGLQPFFAQQFIAGSHVKLNRRIFQRTAAVNTAAFPKIDTHCEFFYVPLRLLWSRWYDFKLNIQDYNSSKFASYNSNNGATTADSLNCPYFNLDDVQIQVYEKLADNSYSSAYFTSQNNAAKARRLLDALGYGYNMSYTGTASQYLVNAFKLLAYQKVYFDHFRNTAYESNDPFAYNVDYFSSSPSIPATIMRKLLTYRYVNYRKDYFQAVYPALNYVSSNPNGLTWTIPNSVVAASGQLVSSDAPTPADIWNRASSVLVKSNTLSTGTSVFSVQQVRAAFALDKLMRASSYAPKHVKDQMEARFGVKGVESGNESVRIGAFMNDIVIGEVTSTSDVSIDSQGSSVGGALGAIGGKGVGSDSFGQDIEFTCKDDCIILGVMYSLPRSCYDSTCVNEWNKKLSREDFFNPEYMNLGMQPLYSDNMVMFDTKSYLGTTNVIGPSKNYILGYQPRYMEYKEGIDHNHGQFNTDGVLSDFVNHTNNFYHWWNNSDGVYYTYFKVKPSDLDTVFAQNTDEADDTTDKFITHLDVKCICNQNMSVHGQPSSNGL